MLNYKILIDCRIVWLSESNNLGRKRQNFTTFRPNSASFPPNIHEFRMTKITPCLPFPTPDSQSHFNQYIMTLYIAIPTKPRAAPPAKVPKIVASTKRFLIPPTNWVRLWLVSDPASRLRVWSLILTSFYSNIMVPLSNSSLEVALLFNIHRSD